METILINDQVTASTGSDHPYEGVTGTVTASRRDHASGLISHKVSFPRRVYSEEEQERGEDRDPAENVIWFLASELTLAA